MAVYVAFNEYEGVDSPTNLVENTVCSVSGVATHGFRHNTIPDGTSDSVDLTLPTALTTGWVHTRLALGANAANRSAGDVLVLKDTGGSAIASLSRTSTSFGSAPCSLRVDTVLTPLTTVVANDDGPFNIDINFNLDAVTGFVKIYVDGVLVLSDLGDTLATSGVTQVDTVTFFDPGTINTATDADTDGECVSWGQVIVSDSITTNGKVFTLYPSAGSINDWDTGTVTDVDERGVNDADRATTTTNGDQFTVDTAVSLSTPTLPNRFTALVQTFRANYDTSSPVTKVTPLLNDTTSTSTSYGTQQTLTTGLANYRYVWSVDPADAADWTSTKINNYEFGLRADT